MPETASRNGGPAAAESAEAARVGQEGPRLGSPAHRGARVDGRRATLPLRSVGERSDRGRGQTGRLQLPVRVTDGAEGVVVERDK